MNRLMSTYIVFLGILLLVAPVSFSAQSEHNEPISQDAYLNVVRQMEDLKKKIEQMTEAHNTEIRKLKTQLDRLSASVLPATPSPVAPAAGTSEKTKTDETALYDTIRQKAGKPLEKDAVVRGLDLDASVVIDTFYYHDDSKEGMSHLKNEISGLGHSHGAESEHHHAEVENGFNLRHVELGLSAAVDPYFRSWTTLAVEDGESEIEEAVIQTTCLPWGFTLSGGKLLSGIGRMNRQHSHNWDFFDQPLVYELLLGPHGLQEKGAQLTWLAPMPFYLLFGAESFNGENEKMFQKVDAEEVPEKDGPRLWTGFLKIGPQLGPRHGAQIGFSYAEGYHQEVHDGNADGNDDHWLHGKSRLYGADFVYKFNAQQAHGWGDVVLQGEYFFRKKDLDVEAHELVPAFIGRSRVDEQDGYYVQALYGLFPRWRTGLRWEQVGVTNDVKLPDLSKNTFDESDRISAMLDWKLSEFSLIRAQCAHSELELTDDSESVWEWIIQWQVNFGKHAAHEF